jgi:hypothetical protein
MARPPLNPSLGDVQAALADAIDELAQPPTRKERKNGWIEETRTEVSAYLRAIPDDIDSGDAAAPARFAVAGRSCEVARCNGHRPWGSAE